MSGLITRAEKRALVARAPNADDGRATDVFLTRQGVKLVKHLHARAQQALAPLTEHSAQQISSSFWICCSECSGQRTNEQRPARRGRGIVDAAGQSRVALEFCEGQR
jgi:hypothetical protein